MGGLVEEAIAKSVGVLRVHDPNAVQFLREIEKRIDDEHIAIDQICLELIARLSPVAADLRLILAIVKINTDLERIGDQAMNVTYNVEHASHIGGVRTELDLARMADLVRAMVRDSLDALLNADVAMAKRVLAADDEVDRFKDDVTLKMTELMKSNPADIPRAIDMIFIARSLERMADHATNVAEDVIFAYTGVDVRHQSVAQVVNKEGEEFEKS